MSALLKDKFPLLKEAESYGRNPIYITEAYTENRKFSAEILRALQRVIPAGPD